MTFSTKVLVVSYLEIKYKENSSISLTIFNSSFNFILVRMIKDLFYNFNVVRKGWHHVILKVHIKMNIGQRSVKTRRKLKIIKSQSDYFLVSKLNRGYYDCLLTNENKWFVNIM